MKTGIVGQTARPFPWSPAAEGRGGLSPAVPDPETVVLVAGANDRFALGLTVALSSALRHLDPSRPVHVYVLDGGLAERSLMRCRECLAAARPDAEITVVADDPARFADLDHQGYSRAAFLRLSIPEFVPATYRRVLYLDSDVVVGDDVARLWALPDDGRAFWAGHEHGIAGTGYRRDPVVFAGVPEATPMFNSGVMLIEMAQWKAARVSERALAMLSEHSARCITADQDALNAVAFAEWGALPPRWNFQVRGPKAMTDLPDPGDTPAIVHFLDHKPWTPGADCLHQERFEAALRASGWYSSGEMWRHRSRRGVQRARRWLRGSPVLGPLRAGRRSWRRRSGGT